MDKFLSNCENLKRVDLSGLDTSKVVNMNHFFSFCINLESADVSNFDTSNVNSIRAFLDNAQSLKSINLANFDTHKVSDIRAFLNNCYNLITVDLTSFDLSGVRDSSLFFNNCRSLRSIIGEHTLEDVENGLKTLFGTIVSILIHNTGYLRYSSMLAMLNGFADMTGGNAPTVGFRSTAWNNMRNDDDTIPISDVIAERQARLSAIAAQKNWTIAVY